MEEVKAPKSTRAAFIISMSIIGVAILFIIIAAALAFTPVKIIQTRTQPYKVTTPIVAPGDPIIYIADVCKYKETLSVVTRTFVDENNVRYPLPDMKSNVPKGCNNNKVIVPTLGTMHAGKWYLTLDVQYQVNVLRTQTYHLTTETFNIKK